MRWANRLESVIGNAAETEYTPLMKVLFFIEGIVFSPAKIAHLKFTSTELTNNSAQHPRCCALGAMP
jgi:hypothetical protein